MRNFCGNLQPPCLEYMGIKKALLKLRAFDWCPSQLIISDQDLGGKGTTVFLNNKKKTLISVNGVKIA